MKLSTRGKYGTYAMIFLAQHGGEGPVSLKAFAPLGLPEAYLEQLLGSLRRAGLVSASRGAQGGYRLSRPAEDISARDILEALEGPLSFSDCVNDAEPCARSEGCPARGVWEYLTGRVNGLMEEIALSDMIRQSPSGQK